MEKVILGMRKTEKVKTVSGVGSINKKYFALHYKLHYSKLGNNYVKQYHNDVQRLITNFAYFCVLVMHQINKISWSL